MVAGGEGDRVGDAESVPKPVVGMGEVVTVTVTDPLGDKLRVTVLRAVEGPGVGVTVTVSVDTPVVGNADGDGDPEGVSNAVVGSALRDTVRLPEGDPVGVTRAVVGKGERDNVMVLEGDPEKVLYIVLGTEDGDNVPLPEGEPVLDTMAVVGSPEMEIAWDTVTEIDDVRDVEGEPVAL